MKARFENDVASNPDDFQASSRAPLGQLYDSQLQSSTSGVGIRRGRRLIRTDFRE